jgi:hypothetical protein
MKDFPARFPLQDGHACGMLGIEHFFLIRILEAGMARQTWTTDDTPERTPSFVCEVPLQASPAQERLLLARLEAARQVYNACLGQARRRVRLVRES